MAVRKAYAKWTGSLPDGSGTMAFGSGAFEGQYSFGSRFEEGTGTNPEELIGAAHAGCFSMALSGELGRAGVTPESIETEARVHLDKSEQGFSITRIELITTGTRPRHLGRGLPAARRGREGGMSGVAGARRHRDHARGDARELGGRRYAHAADRAEAAGPGVCVRARRGRSTTPRNVPPGSIEGWRA